MGISRKEALECFASDDLIGIGMEADAVRRTLHPEGVVSYALDRQIRYNPPNVPIDAIVDHICAEILDTLDMGGTAAILQDQVAPGQTITWFEDLFRALKLRFPTLWLHSLSATEILVIAENSSLALHDTIARLRAAGLDSIPGNDAGILDDAVQPQHLRPRVDTAAWLAVHRTAHTLHVASTATLSFGSGETLEHRINHLESIRNLQQETGGFTSFTPSAYLPQTARAQGFEEATAVEYLKALAISRLYLDNITNIQADLPTQGLKVLQVALRFGSNDGGSILLANGANATTEEQLRQVIRDAGFRPVQRDSLYRTMFLN